MAPPRRSRRSDYAWFDAVSTRWMDNDPYRRWTETAAVNIGRGPGIGLVVESGCRYFAPAAYPDTIHVGVRAGHVGTSRVRYEVGLFRNEEAEAIAEGFFAHVYVDRATQRPTPLPERLRAVVEALRGHR